MKFSELDKKMRMFEMADDTCVLPEIYIVARIDGRGFTHLTKEVHQFEAPYDARFRDLMIETVKSLMQCGFKVIFGYTQSDEISLLFDLSDNGFKRKLRKLNSILAGETSAKFSLLLGDKGVFDCRICQLPNSQLVIDYFRWRNEDANRNALNSYCYWNLRKEGKSPQEASNRLIRLTVAEKNELLYRKGINFNDVPAWQKRGTGVYWETYQKQTLNPITQIPVSTTRNRLKVDLNLPMKEDYNLFIKQFL
ncbi:tRNA(His) guanylyltransferase Thg1 family protein [Aliikangiella coralliicola]|uniref:tRNA(His) guanylyltransferase n=1 Tax=Aliikangiella coralliicola TaxID=2592383 RepID=A0A545UF47_9GAMM|nr:tRNA(His) guanylyltransferase Thg1 family protein [Aliikangiella coralliicola]TQV88013.1 guanylyltransferase [Aliikangiella coralliicola]